MSEGKVGAKIEKWIKEDDGKKFRETEIRPEPGFERGSKVED